ncbi:DUF1929 domain-containing protein [Chromobacterium vaccinii]|nr:DUF1929 domain-containing protein [Chromobacterium vaccinii]MBX9355956.1 DUF1929 domain-containing protein [Chromobacterium vaccinii]
MAHQWQAPFDPQAGEADDNKKALAVHIGLLPIGAQGALVYFSGNRWDGGNHRAGRVDHTVLFDYAARTALRPGSPVGAGGLAPDDYLDVFCSGHALLADGRLLVAGGTSAMQVDAANPHNGHWGGLREATVFDPAAIPSWQPVAQMNTCPVAGFAGKGGGRWYPSLVTLADGSVLALCGHPRIFPASYDEADPAAYPATEDDPRHNNNSPERFIPAENRWQLLNPDGLGEGFLHDFAVFYPRAHQLPDGKLLIVQPLYTSPPDSIDSTGRWAGKTLLYDPQAQSVSAAFSGPQTLEGVYLNPGYAAQFTTSVLLPLLPENGYLPTVMLCGGVKAMKATIATGGEAGSEWGQTGARQAFFNQDGHMAVPPRANALATLLPTGDVFVSGGTNAYKTLTDGSQYDELFGVRVPEIYHPQTDSWTALTDAPAAVTRGYHSVALLMSDGRVLTAGSERNNQFGAASAEYRMEIFEPDYIAAGNRPAIDHAPPAIAYGESFQVRYALAAGTPFGSISRVALTRYGSATHGFDYDQRYVGLTFSQGDGGALRVDGPPNGSVAPPGYYMLWLIDSGGRPCAQAATVRVGGQRLYAVLDRSVFSVYEVHARAGAGGAGVFSAAFYAVFDGFIPNEVMGLTPMAAFSQAGLSATPTPSGSVSNPALELPGSPQLIQRTVFSFDLSIDAASAFAGMSGGDAERLVTLTVSAGDWRCQAQIELVMEPSPFMLDGQPPWLSEDLRVFQVTPLTASRWLPGHSWVDPNDYIQHLIAWLNADSARGQALFAELPTDEQAAALSLLPTEDGTPGGIPLFSFALARARLDSTVSADYARVMFRLFRTMRPSLVYDTATLYRRVVNPVMAGGGEVTEDAIPLLGVEGGDIVSIPFFAEPRVTPSHDMKQQTDGANRMTLPAGPGEALRFFGCWLDINQPGDRRFPRHPGDATRFDNPAAFPGGLASIQELIACFHQCLVAELHYKLDPAAPDLPRAGDTPFTSDKLSQRNLALTSCANPGNAATRVVQHSFELKNTQTKDAPRQSIAAVARGGGMEALVLWWDTLPRSAAAEIYLPGVRAEDVLALLPPAQAPVWRATDEFTLRIESLGDCAFLPLPPSLDGRSLAGLLTVILPAGVRDGQRFRLFGQHFARAQRVVGAFDLQVRVSADHAALLAEDRDQLAILKHILAATPMSDKWWPVLRRQAQQLGDRVAGFGADPGAVAPSPWGAGPHPSTLSTECDVPRAGPCGGGESEEVEIDISGRLRLRLTRRPE